MKVGWAKDKKPTEAEIRAYCREWADVIFVRELLDGRWTNVSLAELPEDLRESWIRTFIRVPMIPFQILKNDQRH